jgi:hypothetical protein
VESKKKGTVLEADRKFRVHRVFWLVRIERVWYHDKDRDMMSSDLVGRHSGRDQ